MKTPLLAKIIEVYQGTWVADITSDEVPDGSFELGGRTWAGTIIPSGYVRDGARYYSRIVGGKGKLGTFLEAKDYQGSLPLARVATDIIAACGETAGRIDASARVLRYERSDGTAGQALTELCEAGGLSWWVDRDGKVNVAPARLTVTPVNPEKTGQIGADIDGGVTLNVDSADDIQPGMISNGSPIRALFWNMNSGSLTAEATPVQPSIPDTRGKEFYLATYSGKVRNQNANWSVDVIVEGKFKMSSVPLMPGLFGIVVLKPGDTVTIGFLNGNRSSPYAVPGQLSSSEDSKSVALQSDIVDVPLPPMAFTALAVIAPSPVPVPITGTMMPMTGRTTGTIQGPSSQRLKTE